MNTNFKNNNIDWNDSIETDNKEYTLLPEGDYNFTVAELTRGTFPGSAKLPPCNKATLKLQIETENNLVTVKTDLILNRVFEFRISSFFRSIGFKKRGEKYIMDWSKVEGSEGRAHIKPRSYTDSSGTEHTVNDVAYFLDKEDYDYDLPF